MEAHKSKEHDGDDTTQEDDNGEHLILSVQILHHDFPIRTETLPLAIYEHFVPQVTFVDQM